MASPRTLQGAGACQPESTEKVSRLSGAALRPIAAAIDYSSTRGVATAISFARSSSKGCSILQNRLGLLRWSGENGIRNLRAVATAPGAVIERFRRAVGLSAIRF